jgi:hypothetical protein
MHTRPRTRCVTPATNLGLPRYLIVRDEQLPCNGQGAGE